MLDSKEISSPELTKLYLDRIKKYDSKLESYITVTEDIALSQAEKAQEIINSLDPVLCERFPLSLEEIFLEEMEDTDYDFEKIFS